MLDIFRGLRGLIKPHRVTIDSSIFRLHYSATVSFLLAFSVITTTRQFVGNPIGQSQSVRMLIYIWWIFLDLHISFSFDEIWCFYVITYLDCVHTKDIPEDVLNTYCWIHSTYTIPSAFWKRIGIDVAHPGIDKTVDPEERRYVRYYQWVCFCLFFQVGWRCPLSIGWCVMEETYEGCYESSCFSHSLLFTFFLTSSPTYNSRHRIHMQTDI